MTWTTNGNASVGRMLQEIEFDCGHLESLHIHRFKQVYGITALSWPTEPDLGVQKEDGRWKKIGLYWATEDQRLRASIDWRTTAYPEGYWEFKRMDNRYFAIYPNSVQTGYPDIGESRGFDYGTPFESVLRYAREFTALMEEHHAGPVLA